MYKSRSRSRSRSLGHSLVTAPILRRLCDHCMYLWVTRWSLRVCCGDLLCTVRPMLSCSVRLTSVSSYGHFVNSSHLLQLLFGFMHCVVFFVLFYFFIFLLVFFSVYGFCFCELVSREESCDDTFLASVFVPSLGSFSEFCSSQVFASLF